MRPTSHRTTTPPGPGVRGTVILGAALLATVGCRSRDSNESALTARDRPWDDARVEDLFACRLSAPSWYRAAWFSFFEEGNVLARKLLEARMRCDASPVTLGADDVADVDARFDFASAPLPSDAIGAAAASGRRVRFEVPARAAEGTLGSFTAVFEGSFARADTYSSPRFEGVVRYEDLWDLADVQPALARVSLPGRPVRVDSVAIPVSLASSSDTGSAMGTASAPLSEWKVTLRGVRPPRHAAFSPRLASFLASTPELTSTGRPTGAEAALLGAIAAKEKHLALARSFELIRGL